MPKVTYTPAKGLVQSSGAGFVINHLKSTSGTVNLDADTFMTVFTTTSAPTLPSSAPTGAIKILISDTAADTSVQATNATTAVTMTNIGDMCICIFDGTEWVIGRSLT